MADMKDITDVPSNQRGSLHKTAGGDTQVQFVREFVDPVQKVWNAFTEPERLANWFPGFQLEHRQGGKYQIWFGDNCEGPAHVEGTIEVFDSPTELRCGNLHWRLAPRQTEQQGDAGTRLTFTDILQFNQGSLSNYEITNSVLAGWHYYMDRLTHALEGYSSSDYDPTDTREYDYAKIDVTGRALP